MTITRTMTESTDSPRLWITGVGSQYPPSSLGPERLEDFAARFHDVGKPGLNKLLKINRCTGIEARPAIHSYETGFSCGLDPPSIKDLDKCYQEHGVNLATQACQKALTEWGGCLSDITHTIAVTCTHQGSPGYDVLVNRKLGLDKNENTERILLQGVGCAGGVAIMRVAADVAMSAATRGRPARILAYACELCTPNVRHELAQAEACTDISRLSIAGALFSDAAAAFVFCNDEGLLRKTGNGNGNGDDDGHAQTRPGLPLFEVLEWGNATIPDTVHHMGMFTEAEGFRTVIGREVTYHTRKAILPLFQRLCASSSSSSLPCDPASFDWALHPGGKAIIVGAQEELGLTEDHLRATKEIYRTRGNSSSSSVLAVLDLLRRLGPGRDHVAVTSFGPGLLA
ncbi:thiolase-like protein [Apiospora arundinis]|uniref:Thiolase-like protein n=1 Tax=Apiospora arundinis TaxID=335852 RepID=A0ABR2JLE3_9PEZI